MALAGFPRRELRTGTKAVVGGDLDQECKTASASDPVNSMYLSILWHRSASCPNADLKPNSLAEGHHRERQRGQQIAGWFPGEIDAVRIEALAAGPGDLIEGEMRAFPFSGRGLTPSGDPPDPRDSERHNARDNSDHAPQQHADQRHHAVDGRKIGRLLAADLDTAEFERRPTRLEPVDRAHGCFRRDAQATLRQIYLRRVRAIAPPEGKATILESHLRVLGQPRRYPDLLARVAGEVHAGRFSLCTLGDVTGPAGPQVLPAMLDALLSALAVFFAGVEWGTASASDPADSLNLSALWRRSAS